MTASNVSAFSIEIAEFLRGRDLEGVCGNSLLREVNKEFWMGEVVEEEGILLDIEEALRILREEAA